MSKQITITCDGCNEVIKTTTGYESDAYLELSNVWKGHAGGAVMGMSLGPAIKNTQHFHDLRCLKRLHRGTDLPTEDLKPASGHLEAPSGAGEKGRL